MVIYSWLSGYLVVLCVEWWCCAIFHLHCSFVPIVVPLDIASPIIFFQTFISCTGGQSVSYVLLLQPSDCIHLFVIDCVVLFSENKYDDDELRL